MRFVLAVTVLALFGALALGGTAANFKQETTFHGPNNSIKTIRGRFRSAHRGDGRVRDGTLQRRGLDVVATDPPVEQAHGMMVSFQSFCASQWNVSDSQIYSGGWKVAPPAIIYGALSGKILEGFEGEADPGHDHINASVTYAANPGWVIAMAFAAVEGEWEYAMSSPTVLNATITSCEIGKKAVYTILSGDSTSYQPKC